MATVYLARGLSATAMYPYQQGGGIAALRRLIAMALACSMVPTAAIAQNPTTGVKLDVTLDRADWLYNFR